MTLQKGDTQKYLCRKMSEKKLNQKDPAAPQKTMTRYDQKMQRRAEEAAREQKRRKTGICIGAAAAAIILIFIGYFIYNGLANRYATYLTVGGHPVKKAEFDYYYNTSYQNFMSYYSGYSALIGLDSSKPLSSQAYTEDMTWDDFFAQQAAESLQRVYSITDRAKEDGFEYDTAADVENAVSALQSAAKEAGMSDQEYLSTIYGKYISMEKVRAYASNSALADAYEESLIEQEEISSGEVNDYYEENKDSYDSIDYKLMRVASSEDADAVLSQITDEASFDTLFEEYDIQEDAESTYTGVTKATLGHTSASSWLFDQSRQTGDTTIVEVTADENYYVIYFLDRYLDESENEDGTPEWYAAIESTLKNEAVSAYLEELADSYAVTDNRAKLQYLKIAEKQEDISEEESAAES